MSGSLAITEDAVLWCDHHAHLENKPSQDILRIAERRVLVAHDPEGRLIHGCPNLTPATRPCITSLVVERGYSSFVRVAGAAVCLETIEGFTDGTPPGVVQYIVHEPGQDFVTVSE